MAERNAMAAVKGALLAALVWVLLIGVLLLLSHITADAEEATAEPTEWLVEAGVGMGLFPEQTDDLSFTIAVGAVVPDDIVIVGPVLGGHPAFLSVGLFSGVPCLGADVALQRSVEAGPRLGALIATDGDRDVTFELYLRWGVPFLQGTW
jgi:hypothetical protein